MVLATIAFSNVMDTRLHIICQALTDCLPAGKMASWSAEYKKIIFFESVTDL